MSNYTFCVWHLPTLIIAFQQSGTTVTISLCVFVYVIPVCILHNILSFTHLHAHIHINASFIPNFWIAITLLASCERLFVSYNVAIVNITEHHVAVVCFVFHVFRRVCACACLLFSVGCKLYLSMHKDRWKYFRYGLPPVLYK